MRRLGLTWIAASLVVVAAARDLRTPSWPVPSAVSATTNATVTTAQTVVHEVDMALPQLTFKPRAARNTLLSVGDRIVEADSDIHQFDGTVSVTLLDGRTGEIIRTTVTTKTLDDPKDGWRWWYTRH